VLSAWHLKGRHFSNTKTAKGKLVVIERKPPHPVVALIMRLLENQRIKHLKRFQAAGAI
jgi:hypothetical protein